MGNVVFRGLGLACVLGLAGCGTPAAASPDKACGAGVWRAADGRVVSLWGTTEGKLRWRTMDGRSALIAGMGAEARATRGWTGEPDPTPLALGDCAQGLTAFDGQPVERVELEIIETRFQGAGETLAGRLILPPGDGPAPILVEVHGSGDYSALDFNAMQHLDPAAGVGLFVYDKRGTGASTGAYTQDFAVLAADAAAAVREARRLAGDRAGRVGLRGLSQGGWVAPLAAAQAPVDFIIVGYGLAVSPLEENRAQTMLGVAEAGFDAEAQRKAGLLADAAGEVIASGFRSGFAELNALKRQWRREPWFPHAKGEFTGDLARYPEAALRLVGPRRDKGTTWRHDPLPPLRALDVPVLWILAGADRDAPPEATRALLSALQAEGEAITLAEFPDTDHGMVEFIQAPDGTRTWVRQAEGYYALMSDFALGRPLEQGRYGRAAIAFPRAAP